MLVEADETTRGFATVTSDDQDRSSAPPARRREHRVSGTLPKQADLFDISDGVTYLNCAFMSPQLRAVTEAGRLGVERKARPWEIGPPDFFDEVEELRELFAGLVSADADGVAVVPSVSYGVTTAAAQLSPAPGSAILVLEDQFPSHVYPWRSLAARTGSSLRTVTRPSDFDWTGAVLEALDESTSVVAVPACHWTDGSTLDLAPLAAAARHVGAALVVDGTQAVGATPIDLGRVQPDFLVTAGYKWLMGPYSLGFVWVHPRHRSGDPIEHAWSGRAASQDFSRLAEYRDEFRPGARRFDVGETANFALVPMAIAAIRQLQDWGVDRISATCRLLTDTVAERASELGFGVPPQDRRSAHMIGLRLPPTLDPTDLAGRLQSQSIYVSIRGDAMRVSPHVYNDSEDVSTLIAALESAVESSTTD